MKHRTRAEWLKSPAAAAERPQRGHEINRFEDVRLALRVVAQKQMEAGHEIRVQPGVITKVPQPQMSQMHAENIGAGTTRPRVFSKQLLERLHLKTNLSLVAKSH